VIRTGYYDAFDKWEILCRYWQDPGTAVAVGVDRFNLPILPRWHQVAKDRGTRFGIWYLAARLAMPRLGAPGTPSAPGGPAQTPASSIEAEIVELAARHGPGSLQSQYRQLVNLITNSGFEAPFDGDLPQRVVERLRQVFKRGALEALQWTEDDGEVPSLEVLRYFAPLFPKDALRHHSNVLSLFSCRFYGKGDAINLYDACPEQVTLVDINSSAMTDMQLIYPANWKYIVADYKEFVAEAATDGRSYDLIVADPWLTMAKEVGWDFLGEMMKICSDSLMTNYSNEMFSELGVERDDLAGLSRAVSRRCGVEVTVEQTLARNRDVCWVVMRKPPGRSR
jgi:hypothetical protein